jgi:glycosyltransferase involved in cell wall biosynthesis
VNNKFVFVVPYYNAIDDISKTIYSMMAQSYENWRAILINDVSSDGGENLVQQICESSPIHKNKFTLINNNEKYGEVRNTLASIENIEDEEIVCRLDGGDWLLENDLLWILNQIYQNEKCAVTWTAHRWGYTNQNISGNLRLQARQTVYQHPWVSSHLKTFRCKQLKKVPKANFFTQDGQYIMIACDQAIFLPMMHLSIMEGKELNFLPLTAYHYNIDLGNKNLFTSQRAINQKMSAEMIRARGFIE